MGNGISKLDALQASSAVVALVSLVAGFRNRHTIKESVVRNLTILIEMVKENQLLQTIAIPSAFGFVLYLTRMVWAQLYAQLRLLLYCSVSISSKDRNFGAVIDFVSKLQVSKPTAGFAIPYHENLQANLHPVSFPTPHTGCK